MTIQARPPHGREDDDGVRIVALQRGRRMRWLIGLAIALPVVATLTAVAVIRLAPADEPIAMPPPPAQAEPEAKPEGVPAASAPTPAPSRAADRYLPRRIVAGEGEPPQGLGASPVPEPEKPRREIDAADVIVMLREEGEHGGIAAFGIPGTDPPKSGIIVPEEFELPEGFVRHYQSTDDGEQLPAILMFHPDYEFVDDNGMVLKLPENGVVPPEMAPPGLAVDNLLEVPERKRGEPIR